MKEVSVVVGKGERARREIVARSAPVFNTRGYFGTSMGELVRETGFKKGGIYNHFSGKEALALAAFEHAVGVMRGRFEGALEGKEGALERLMAVVDVLGASADEPPVAGGCPVLNTAVEADDAHPALREKARGAAEDWLRLVGRTVKDGVRGGELRPDVEPREVASVVVSTLEGAVMLSKLCDDQDHMRRAIRHVKGYLEALASRPGEV